MFNEILEGGLNQVIVKRLGMQVGTAVPAVQPEMAVDLTLESDRPEWGWLKGEYSWGRTLAMGAPAAGNHCALILDNPTGSNVLIVVKRIITTTTARTANVSTYAATFINGFFGLPVDGRQPGSARGGIIEATFLTANLPAICEQLSSNVPTDTPYILQPGRALVIAQSSAATAMNAAVVWTERPGLPGELG